MSEVLTTVVTHAGVEIDVYASGVAYCNRCHFRIALWDDREELELHECEDS